MAKPVITPDNRERFLGLLNAASKETGLVIGGCGCCGSPWVTTVDEDEVFVNYQLLNAAYDEQLSAMVEPRDKDAVVLS